MLLNTAILCGSLLNIFALNLNSVSAAFNRRGRRVGRREVEQGVCLLFFALRKRRNGANVSFCNRLLDGGSLLTFFALGS